MVTCESLIEVGGNATPYEKSRTQISVTNIRTSELTTCVLRFAPEAKELAVADAEDLVVVDL